MSTTQPADDEYPIFEVTVYDQDVKAQSSRFGSLAEAEAFAEQWLEQVPGSRYEIEDLTGDHTAWEAVDAETAMDVEYPDVG